MTDQAQTWWERTHGSDTDTLIAYFSMEFAVDARLPIYSGGLGVLAGDHLKAAADLGVPLVGIGLFYRGGYFTQGLSAEGRQTEDYRPVVEGPFGPMAVNVAAQRRDPESLLNWMERMIRRRRELPEIGWGPWHVLESDVRSVLAHRCDWEDRSFVGIHNLAADPCVARVNLGPDLPAGGRMVDLFDEEGEVRGLERPAALDPAFGQISRKKSERRAGIYSIRPDAAAGAAV